MTDFANPNFRLHIYSFYVCVYILTSFQDVYDPSGIDWMCVWQIQPKWTKRRRKHKKIIINNKMKIYNTKFLSQWNMITFFFSFHFDLSLSFFLNFCFCWLSRSRRFSLATKYVCTYTHTRERRKKEINQQHNNAEWVAVCDLLTIRSIGIIPIIFCRSAENPPFFFRSLDSFINSFRSQKKNS